MTTEPTPDFATVAALLRQLCQEELADLSPRGVLLDLPGMDSMRLLEAAALLEEHYSVELDLGAVDGLVRVEDLLRAVATAPPRRDAGVRE